MSLRTRILTGGAASVAALSFAATPLAAATPSEPVAHPVAAQELSFAIPAIGGIEAGPGGVPGGSFQQTHVIARPAAGSSVTFTVANPAPWHYQYAYRYLSVSWRNLTTGASGTVALRHWQRPAFAPGTVPVTGYPVSLPTSAAARTGAGPVVATVTVLREQYSGTVTSSIIPGLNALLVP